MLVSIAQSYSVINNSEMVKEGSREVVRRASNGDMKTLESEKRERRKKEWKKRNRRKHNWS
jgi:hypothetical protein